MAVINEQLARISDRIASFGKENLDEMLHMVGEGVRLISSVERVRIYLEDLTRGALSCAYSCGDFADHGTPRGQLHVPLGGAIVDADGADAGLERLYDASNGFLPQGGGHRVTHFHEIRRKTNVPVGNAADGDLPVVDHGVEAQLGSLHVLFDNDAGRP